MSSAKTIILMMASLAVASQSFAYDITDAINATLKNNIQLKDSEIKLKTTKLNKFAAATSFLPSIAFQNSNAQTVVDNDSRNYTQNSNTLSISQEIFSGGKGIYSIKSSGFASEAAMISYQNSIDAAVLQTVQDYQGVVSARETYDVSKQNIVTLEAIVKQSEIKLKVGATTITDTLEAKARLAIAVSEKEKSYTSKIKAEEDFKYTTGEVAPQKMQGIDIKPLALPYNPEEFLDEIDNNSPSIKVAEKSLLAQQYQTKVAQSMFFPTVTASATGFDQREFGPVRTKGSKYQLSINIPIFQRGMEYVQTKKAILDEALASNQRNDAILKANKDAASAWNEYVQSKAIVESSMESVKYYKAFAEGADKEFEIGTKTLTELLQAQQNYESARTSLIQNKANLVLSSLKLKYLLGQMKDVDFSKLVLKDESDTKKKIKVQKKETIPADKIERVSQISTE